VVNPTATSIGFSSYFGSGFIPPCSIFGIGFPWFSYRKTHGCGIQQCFGVETCASTSPGTRVFFLKWQKKCPCAFLRFWWWFTFQVCFPTVIHPGALIFSWGLCRWRKEYMMKLLDDNSYERKQMLYAIKVFLGVWGLGFQHWRSTPWDMLS